jgi:hypothetical protein
VHGFVLVVSVALMRRYGVVGLPAMGLCDGVSVPTSWGFVFERVVGGWVVKAGADEKCVKFEQAGSRCWRFGCIIRSLDMWARE